MSDPLYSADILRLALVAGSHPRLGIACGSDSARTPVCGSSITTDVALDDSGAVRAVGFDIHACAFGQASAGLFATGAIGKRPAELARAASELGEWLSGDRPMPPNWPGIEVLVAVRTRPARHAAVLLPFQTGSLAARHAAVAHDDRTAD